MYIASCIAKNTVMKTWLVLIFISSLAIEPKAQDRPHTEVPAVVLSAFKQKYSSAENVKWETKGDSYKAEFKVGSRGHDVWLDKSGKITKHKEDFPKKELPPSIQQKLSSDFQSYKLDDADKIETDGHVFYEVKLDGATDDRKVLFSEDGKIQENEVD